MVGGGLARACASAYRRVARRGGVDVPSPPRGPGLGRGKGGPKKGRPKAKGVFQLHRQEQEEEDERDEQQEEQEDSSDEGEGAGEDEDEDDEVEGEAEGEDEDEDEDEDHDEPDESEDHDRDESDRPDELDAPLPKPDRNQKKRKVYCRLNSQRCWRLVLKPNLAAISSANGRMIHSTIKVRPENAQPSSSSPKTITMVTGTADRRLSQLTTRLNSAGSERAARWRHSSSPVSTWMRSSTPRRMPSGMSPARNRGKIALSRIYFVTASGSVASSP